MEPNNTKNLDLYLRNAINAYRFNATDFHIDLATTTNAQLAGKPAYVLVFSDTFNGFPMKTMVMGTFGDKHGDDKGKFYYVFYTAEASRYDQLLPAVHQMIDSFKISRPTPSRNSKHHACHKYNRCRELELRLHGKMKGGTI